MPNEGNGQPPGSPIFDNSPIPEVPPPIVTVDIPPATEPILYMDELFKSKQFHTYQVRLIAMMNNVVSGFMSQGKLDQAIGAMELARKIINHPAILRPGDDAIAQKIQANKKRFQSNFIMSDGILSEDDDE